MENVDIYLYFNGAISLFMILHCKYSFEKLIYFYRIKVIIIIMMIIMIVIMIIILIINYNNN